MSKQIILTLVGYFLFSSGVGAMLPPLPGKERTFYGWLYRTLQRIAANADRLAEARFGNVVGEGKEFVAERRHVEDTTIATGIAK